MTDDWQDGPSTIERGEGYKDTLCVPTLPSHLACQATPLPNVGTCINTCKRCPFSSQTATYLYKVSCFVSKYMFTII